MMMSRAHMLLLVLTLCGGGAVGRAQTVVSINFDGLTAFSHPLEQYAGLGIHFSTGDYGAVPGITNGDPGNWLVDGSVGPYFLGFNGITAYAETVTLDLPATHVALDVTKANTGSFSAFTFTLNGFDSSNTLVATQTVTLSSVNTWTTLSLTAAAITKIQFSSSNNFAVDHLQFTQATAVPEPGVSAMFAMGLVMLGLGVRRRCRR